MSINRIIPLFKLFLLPSLTLAILGVSAYFADKPLHRAPR
jgi:hypothetical protein